METTTFIWMFVVLKIPIMAALWLIWWAVQEPDPVAGDEDDGGSNRPDRPRGPRRPGPTRRGPHAGSPPPSPPRVRAAVAKQGVESDR